MFTAVPLLALSALFTLALAQSCSEQDGLPKDKIVSATGIGTRHFEGEIAVVNLAIHVRAMTTQATDEELFETSAKLKTFLLDQEVENLEAPSFSIKQSSEIGIGSRGSGGFIGRALYAFEVSSKKLQVVVAGALAAGASEVTDVSFKGAEEAKRTARKEALEDAVSFAKAEAEIATAVIGMKLGRCVRVQINDSLSNDPISVETPENDHAPFEMVGSRPTRTGGGQSTTAAVTLHFEIVQ